MWGTEQQIAFESLKSSLASAETLVHVYFDGNTEETRLVTDADPVGLVVLSPCTGSRRMQMSNCKPESNRCGT